AGTALGIVLAGALGACGDETPLPKGDLRLVLKSASVDGAPPADGFSLVNKDGVRAHLVKKPGAAGEYVAQGADGTYRLDAPPEYGVIGEAEPASRRGIDPIVLWVGRKRTLYVVPKPGWRVLDALVLPEKTAHDATTDLPGKRETGEDGRVALRLDEESWGKGPLFVTAL